MIRILAPIGAALLLHLVLIQPNHRLCAANYFDDPTHRTIFDDANIGEWLARAGLRPVEIVPGLLPIANFDKVQGFARKCGASIPPSLAARFDRVAGNPADTRALATTWRAS